MLLHDAAMKPVIFAGRAWLHNAHSPAALCTLQDGCLVSLSLAKDPSALLAFTCSYGEAGRGRTCSAAAAAAWQQ